MKNNKCRPSFLTWSVHLFLSSKCEIFWVIYENYYLRSYKSSISSKSIPAFHIMREYSLTTTTFGSLLCGCAFTGGRYASSARINSICLSGSTSRRNHSASTAPRRNVLLRFKASSRSFFPASTQILLLTYHDARDRSLIVSPKCIRCLQGRIKIRVWPKSWEFQKKTLWS